MQNRKGIPKFKCKSMTHCDVKLFRKGNMAVLCWKDKKPVTLVSNKQKASKIHMTEVPNKNSAKPTAMKPNMVIGYSKHMGGVDGADHYIIISS